MNKGDFFRELRCFRGLRRFTSGYNAALNRPLDQLIRQRGIQHLLLLCTALLISYLLLLDEPVTHLSELNKEAIDLRQSLKAQTEQQLIQQKNAEDLNTQLGRSRTIMGLIPEHDDLPGLIEHLTESAHRHNVSLQKITPQRSPRSDSPIITSIQLELSGRYAAIGHFIASITQLNRLITTHDFSLSAEDRMSDRLSMQLEIRVYSRF